MFFVFSNVEGEYKEGRESINLRVLLLYIVYVILINIVFLY